MPLGMLIFPALYKGKSAKSKDALMMYRPNKAVMVTLIINVFVAHTLDVINKSIQALGAPRGDFPHPQPIVTGLYMKRQAMSSVPVSS